MVFCLKLKVMSREIAGAICTPTVLQSCPLGVDSDTSATIEYTIVASSQPLLANNLGFKWPRNCTKKSNYRSKKMFPVRHSRRRRIKREEKAKVVAVVCGMKLIHFLAAPDIFCLPGWFWRMNKIKATWWIGCIEKMDDHPVQALPIHHPTKMDVLPKTFIQIILAAKWHSSTSPQTTAMIFAFSAVFILLLSSKL